MMMIKKKKKERKKERKKRKKKEKDEKETKGEGRRATTSGRLKPMKETVAQMPCALMRGPASAFEAAVASVGPPLQPGNSCETKHDHDHVIFLMGLLTWKHEKLQGIHWKKKKEKF